MGAGSSTEQRSPEQPEAGVETPAEPEPGALADSAVAAADTATKVREPATCWVVEGGGVPRGATRDNLAVRPT